VSISPTCDAFAADASGNPGAVALATGVSLPAINIPSLGSGSSVAPGTSFVVSTASTKITLPGAVTQPVPATVVEVKNIVLNFSIKGAGAVGAPTLSGGNVLGASAKSTKTSFVLTLPGSKNGSTLPKGKAFFPGGSSFTTPSIKMNVKAPAASGTITTSLTTMSFLVQVSVGGNALAVVLGCTAPPNTIGSVAVVTPGAPEAVNDEASTKAGQAVTIDVLANDKPNGFGQKPDPTTLTIASNPAHGTAKISGGKAVYTPGAGFTNRDSFTYQVCDAVANPTTTTTSTTLQPEAARAAAPAGTSLRCSVATVTISAQKVQATVPPTTVAVLPRTGSSSTPLALLGIGLCTLGLAALAGTSRRRFSIR